MHVLPLPFGLALVVLGRRDAEKLRPEPEPQYIPSAPTPRERILEDARNLYLRRVA